MSEMFEAQRPLIDVAITYAAHGWPVIPLHTPVNSTCDCIRQECTVPGKHPRTQHGLTEASTDERQIRSWWSKWNNANIGIITGVASGLIVLDLDTRNEGSTSLDVLQQTYGPLPETLIVHTPSGGRHFYFIYPKGVQVGSKIGFRKGLDIRANGGFVVAPPSRGANGKQYAWGNIGVVPAPFPTWLIPISSQPEKQEGTLEGGREKPRIFLATPDAPGNYWLQKANYETTISPMR